MSRDGLRGFQRGFRGVAEGLHASFMKKDPKQPWRAFRLLRRQLSRWAVPVHLHWNRCRFPVMRKRVVW